MTSHLNRIRSEQGFTLIELLVVIVVIGVLSAIALPAFLDQRSKSQDTAAKSNARNMVSQLEACFLVNTSYVGCQVILDSTETGLPVGPAPGQVQIVSTSPDGYVVTATSTGRSGGAFHTFTITKTALVANDHDCTIQGEGSCPVGGDW